MGANFWHNCRVCFGANWQWWFGFGRSIVVIFGGVTSPHVAIGTSAFAVAINAASGLVSHHIKGNVKWCCAVVFTIAGVIGSFIGSSIGKLINGDILLIAFAVVMMIIAYFRLTNKNQTYNINVRLTRDNAPSFIPKLLGFGFIIGLAAGFFGIGVGFLVVPALIYVLKLPIIYAIGTSLFAVILIFVALYMIINKVSVII